MDIDLLAGLATPKTTKTELSTPETAEQPEGALPDFAALLDGAKPDSPENQDSTPDLEMPVLVPVAQPHLTASDAPLEQETNTADSIGTDAPKTAAGTATISASPLLPDAALAPTSDLAKQAEPTTRAPINIEQAASATIMAKPSVPVRGIKPEQASAPFAHPEPREMADMRGRRIVAKTKPVTIAPKDPTEPKTVANPAFPFNKADILPDKTSIESKPDTVAAPAKPTSKTTVQVSPQPTSTVGFANIKTLADDPAEMQFGIKIEHQSIETAPVSRPSHHAPPVTSQITAQLPQLLTKAEKQTVELRLDPPELGRVTIHLSTHDTQVTAHVVADRIDTVDLMRRHTELLSTTLANAGFAQADLSFQHGHRQDTEDEHTQLQTITGFSEGDGSTNPTPTLTGQDGRLDIRL